MSKYQAVKNNKGFTLVEVIVVAVIVLILAAVAIPLYQGYVQNAREGALENAAGSIATACGSFLALADATTDPCEAQITIANGVGGEAGKFIPLGNAGGGVVGVSIPARMQAVAAGGSVEVKYIDQSQTSHIAYAQYKGVANP